MRVSIYVARTEDEAAPELKRILSKAVLVVSCFFRPLARNRVVFAEDMEHRCALQLSRIIGFPLLVYQKGKGYARLHSKQPGVVHVAQADRRQTRSLRNECVLICA